MSVYDADDSTEEFHKRIIDLHSKARIAKPTRFHEFLSHLGTRGVLTRVWSQNVDGIEDKVGNLSTCYATGRDDPFPRTFRLHGTLEEMVCQESKSHCFPFDPQLFTGSKPPDCKSCVDSNNKKRAKAEMLNRPPTRLSSCVVGKLRPNITLYEEFDEGPDVAKVLRRDFSKRRSPDCVLIVGTRLKTAGARRLLGQICRRAKMGNSACDVIYIDKEQQSLGRTVDSCINVRVKGDCQDFASFMEEN